MSQLRLSLRAVRTAITHASWALHMQPHSPAARLRLELRLRRLHQDEAELVDLIGRAA